jgi:hypothetical protein
MKRSGRRRLRWLAACLVGCLPASLLTTRAMEQTPSEYDVKAAFLLNFMKFVDWPSTAFADADSPIAICILGKDPFGRTMDELAKGESVNGRKLIVRKLAEPPPSKTCQMVFVHGPGKEAAKTIGAMGKGVLTVGEGEEFVREGGIIAFVMENRRVRFDINSSAAEGAGLTLSSKLMTVARSILK